MRSSARRRHHRGRGHRDTHPGVRHEVREIADRLNDIQHDNFQNIISAVHVHLDEHNCLEVLILKGASRVVKKIADRLLSIKNVRHGKLTITTTGSD